MWRFEGGPQRRDTPSQRWLAQPESPTLGQGLGSGLGHTHIFPSKAKQQAITSKNSDNDFDVVPEGKGQVDQGPGLGPGQGSAQESGLGPGQGYSKYYYNGIASITALWSKPTTTPTSTITHSKSSTEQQQQSQQQQTHTQHHHHQEKVKIRMTPAKPVGPAPIAVAIMGGHMNNHPAGQVNNNNQPTCILIPSHTFTSNSVDDSPTQPPFLYTSFSQYVLTIKISTFETPDCIPCFHPILPLIRWCYTVFSASLLS